LRKKASLRSPIALPRREHLVIIHREYVKALISAKIQGRKVVSSGR
jgi:hypothetical protein